MSWLGTLIAVVVIVLYVMTFITEPGLTIEFTKEMVKSGGKLVIKIKDFIKDFKDDDKEEVIKSR